MSMFKKLKGLFIENDPNAPKEEPTAQKEAQVKQESVATESNTTTDTSYETPAPTPQSGKPNSKFVDILLKAVEKNNMEGFDYLEYKSSLQSLANMDMDTPTKYKSALAMAKTMGATQAKLISSANHYLAVLKKENSKFKEALKSQKTKQVTGREGEINEIMKLVKAKKKKIAQLEKEIAADLKKAETLKSGINKAAAKVQATNDSFTYAYQVVTGQIASDVENMKKYLS